MTIGIIAEDSEKTFLGHPRGLFVLFFADMWERFSFYGMRALLIFYLLQHWRFAEKDAYTIYGAYTALVYITPAIGGYLADRYLGAQKAVLFGAILLSIGHCLMAFEDDGGPNSPYLPLFWAALAFIIVGSGFLKANISVIVGQLYAQGDPRRDPAFTIFYMGINIGAALGAIVAGYLGQTYGWRYGFGAAGFGMLAGLIVFLWGRPLLMGRGGPTDPALLAAPVAGIRREWLLYLTGLGLVALVWVLIQHQAAIGWALGSGGAVIVGYVLYTAVFRLDRIDRDRILVALLLIFFSILFWAFYEQAGSSLNVYAEAQVDRRILGVLIPASVFQSLTATYIILLAPLFAALWLWLAKRGAEPSTPAKFGLALTALGAGFLVLVAGDAMAGAARTPVVFIFLIYLLHAVGELCLSPVGLSAMTKLALPRMAGLIMGVWFLATATGNFAAGLIARATGGGSGASTADVYTTVGWSAVGVGAAILLLSPLIVRLMHAPGDGDARLTAERSPA